MAPPEAPAANPSIAAESPSASPRISPEAGVESAATSSQAVGSTVAEVPEPPKEKVSYEGIWTTIDAQGQPFDIVIFPNGQAVTTWTKGADGARGERGYWRRDEQRLTVVYSDGSTDVLEQDHTGFQHRRYSSGSPLTSRPLVESEAKRTEESDAALVGVWQLNKEPDGSHLYISLQSNGRAFSTINGGTEGKWKANEKGVLCEWPDGWIDQIERGPAGWQKRSWIGAETIAPADLSAATRVGEARFSVEP